jgi:hypothetical protein
VFVTLLVTLFFGGIFAEVVERLKEVLELVKNP